MIKTLRQNKRLFFVSCLPKFNKDISPATLSNWIVETIQFCYQLKGAQLASSVKAHSVRVLATSLAFFRQASLDQVIRAGTWCSSNTFIYFYLKDLSLVSGDISRLGPLVAAGVLLETPSRQL